jgi:methylmalonyl-CoA mutase C-terminal domain/subunit
MEVIYLGARQTPKMIVEAALQEGVDVIGLSVLSGIHKEAASSVMQMLEENNATHISLVVGGIIPKADVLELMRMGVKGVFGPGTSIHEVVDFINVLARACAE